MATGSMISSPRIKGRRRVKQFTKALVQAEMNRGKSVAFSRLVKVVSDKELKEIVGLIKT